MAILERNHLLLETDHNPEFDLLNQISQPLLYSTYMSWSDEFVNAYQWLFSVLGTSNIIWCNSHLSKSWEVHKQVFKRWILDVPEDCILAKVDTNIWHYILNNWHYSEDCDKWWDDAEELYPTDDNSQYMHYQNKIKEFEKTISREIGWLKVFDPPNDLKNGRIEYIIPSPIKKEWLVEVVDLCGVNPN